VASLGQIHVKIQSRISLKPGSQMRFLEVTTCDIEEIFLMRCDRAFEMLCIGRTTSLKFYECRGPQRMPKVSRVAWVVVEVVEPRWVAWTP
jgi:hypothetical protein